LDKISPLRVQNERAGGNFNARNHYLDEYFDNNQLNYNASFYEDVGGGGTGDQSRNNVGTYESNNILGN
jgi:hypothetical protein